MKFESSMAVSISIVEVRSRKYLYIEDVIIFIFCPVWSWEIGIFFFPMGKLTLNIFKVCESVSIKLCTYILILFVRYCIQYHYTIFVLIVSLQIYLLYIMQPVNHTNGLTSRVNFNDESLLICTNFEMTMNTNVP